MASNNSYHINQPTKFQLPNNLVNNHNLQKSSINNNQINMSHTQAQTQIQTQVQMQTSTPTQAKVPISLPVSVSSLSRTSLTATISPSNSNSNTMTNSSSDFYQVGNNSKTNINETINETNIQVKTERITPETQAQAQKQSLPIEKEILIDKGGEMFKKIFSSDIINKNKNFVHQKCRSQPVEMMDFSGSGLMAQNNNQNQNSNFNNFNKSWEDRNLPASFFTKEVVSQANSVVSVNNKGEAGTSTNCTNENSPNTTSGVPSVEAPSPIPIQPIPFPQKTIGKIRTKHISGNHSNTKDNYHSRTKSFDFVEKHGNGVNGSYGMNEKMREYNEKLKYRKGSSQQSSNGNLSSVRGNWSFGGVIFL